MKKINWRILNIAFWVELILCYVLPFRVVDNFQYKVGFPIPFISVYDTAIEVNPFMSMYFNPLGLLANGIILYFVILVCVKAYHKIKLSNIDKSIERKGEEK